MCKWARGENHFDEGNGWRRSCLYYVYNICNVLFNLCRRVDESVFLGFANEAAGGDLQIR